MGFAPGPRDGRYLNRSEQGAELDVIVFKALAAPRRHLLRGRRAQRVAGTEADPEPVAVTRVTAIGAKPFEGRDEAEAWLVSCRRDADTCESMVEAALAVVNRAVHAHALAAGDPHVREISRGMAHGIRVGYGSGEELVESRWTAALGVPPPGRRSRRRELIEPEVEVARILGGRSRAYPSEDMALRARLDLDHGRPVQAALQLDAALAALAAEREAAEGDARLSEAIGRRSDVTALRDAALRGSLSNEELSRLEDALSVLERGLRRRRHGGGGG